GFGRRARRQDQRGLRAGEFRRGDRSEPGRRAGNAAIAPDSGGCLMADLTRFAINQLTTKRWTLAEAIEGYARHGVGGIGVWGDYVDEAGLPAAVRMLRDAQLFVPCLCTSAWVNVTEPAAYRAALEENRRRIAMAAAIGARCLVIVPGGLAAG